MPSTRPSMCPASTHPAMAFAIANVITGTTTAADGSLTYASISRLKAGEGCFNLRPEPVNRWGDYFGGAVDPVSGGLWTVGAYAKPLSRTALRGNGAHGSAIFRGLPRLPFTRRDLHSPFADYVNVLRFVADHRGMPATTLLPHRPGYAVAGGDVHHPRCDPGGQLRTFTTGAVFHRCTGATDRIFPTSRNCATWGSLRDARPPPSVRTTR